MGKHSKNAGVMGSEGLTYHERKALGFGTVKERLGKDSVGNYYDCRLTLAPVSDPVCCPSGYLFSREAILENLLAQKKANKRKLAAFEAQQKADETKTLEKAAIDHQAALLAFDRKNHAGASTELASKLKAAVSEEAEALLADNRTASGAVNIKDNEARMKEMNAFWVPSQTPGARALVEKPDMNTFCPASEKKLKLKDLTDVKFTRVPDSKDVAYMDPITRDVFTNASRLMLIKPTGDVVLEETWKSCIKPEGSYNGATVTDDDVLELQRGGTGFAEHDKDAVEAKKFFHLGPGSGLADLRGQHQGPGSRFGLRFTN